MLDGGGSTALVLAGNRVNQLPSNQASERVVVNHLGVIAGGLDGRCSARPNGRYCRDGTWIATCQGGSYSEGDCGAFGCSCEEGLGTAYCVHPYCTNGGNGSACRSNTVIVACEAGRPSEGDCGVFGATCEEGNGSAYCVHPFCTHGGNAVWCLDSERVGTCAMGQYSESPCPEHESCQDGRCSRPGSPEVCDNGSDDDLDGATDCADTDCSQAAECNPPDGGQPTDFTTDGGVSSDSDSDTTGGDRPGGGGEEFREKDLVITGGCSTAFGHGLIGPFCIAWLLLFRSRRPG